MSPKVCLCVILSSLFLLQACHDNDDSKTTNPQTRFIYTSTNDVNNNQVISFAVGENGDLTERSAFDTGGVGDADDGDFDAQGAIRIFGDKLLVVNAGETLGDSSITENNGSISVFQIDDQSGDLSRIDQRADHNGIQNMDSFGIRPVSLDIKTINGITWVIVANQQNVSHCITPTEANTLETCLDQYGNPISEHLADTDTNSRNIYLYRFDPQTGVLTPQRRLATYSARQNGPAQVSFSPNNQKVAVTTLGIANAGYPASEQLSTPAHTFLYDVEVQNNQFSLQNSRYFANDGILASIGFSWSSDSRYVYVSNALLTGKFINDIDSNLRDNEAALISLDTTNSNDLFDSSPNMNSVPSGTGSIITETRPAACWTWLTPNNHLYAVGFNSNQVVKFNVEGNLLTRDQIVNRKAEKEGDSKDIYITYDSRHAYVLGFESHSIGIFDLDEDGKLTEKTSSPLTVNAALLNGENPAITQRFFLGIAGYPNRYSGF
ncbi:hypothetical protein D5018_15745 [Parashewanella curva]|uniref:Lactonase family protein n=1 Tax=Parashewanella curva TaxID=2338552 RepID=A0A3L8PTL9_9GAMM|nr:hypothetical protein [Parashewanella curva]RLV58750.1 hypothetical protein D5018_15745 [Parashewanella curva]